MPLTVRVSSFTQVSCSTGRPTSEAARGGPEVLQAPESRGLCDSCNQTTGCLQTQGDS